MYIWGRHSPPWGPHARLGCVLEFQRSFITWEERKKAGSLELERWAAQETAFWLLSLPPPGRGEWLLPCLPRGVAAPLVSVKEL